MKLPLIKEFAGSWCIRGRWPQGFQQLLLTIAAVKVIAKTRNASGSYHLWYFGAAVREGPE